MNETTTSPRRVPKGWRQVGELTIPVFAPDPAAKIRAMFLHVVVADGVDTETGDRVELVAGAGCGNSMAQLFVKPTDGPSRTAAVDLVDMIGQLRELAGGNDLGGA